MSVTEIYTFIQNSAVTIKMYRVAFPKLQYVGKRDDKKIHT